MSYFDSETRGSSVRSTVFPYTTLFRSIKYGKWSKWNVDCEAGKATKSRTVSTTDYFWSSKKGDWVAGKPFIKTETKKRHLTNDEIRRAHLKPPATRPSRMPSTACVK